MVGLEYASHGLDGSPVAWNANQVKAYLRDRSVETIHCDYTHSWTDDGDYETEQDAPTFWTAQLLALEGVR